MSNTALKNTTPAPQPPALDEQKLNELLGRCVVDFGATSNAPLVVIGDRLGLYRALADGGALSST